MEIAGVTIRRGHRVFAAIASANRDDRQFDDPDTLDLAREPNRHTWPSDWASTTAWAAPLARLEGQIAITTLLRRLPELRLDAPPGPLRRRPGLLLNSLQALPLTFARGGARGRG